MISVDEALTLVLSLAAPTGVEDIALQDADGRILARPATSRLTQPPFDAAAMDGYAIRYADRHDSLTVVGEAAAGRAWDGLVAPGQAVRIFTGAPVPAGADMVVMQENVSRDGQTIRLTDAADKRNIRARGGDFAAGDTVPAGSRLTAPIIGLLAAMNVPRVTVARAPKVAIIAGGDELVRVGQLPGPGQIISSNDLAVAALARAAGAEARIMPLARDTEDSLRHTFAEAEDADLIVTIGGASVGDHDLIAKVSEELGMDRAFHRIAMRPGKPLMAGRLGETVVLGLPGNPVSAIVCGILFMQPLIRSMQNDAAPGVVVRRASLARDLGPEGDRQHYLRARVTEGATLPVIEPFDDQDSARLSLLAQADALMIRPANDPARQAGEVVEWIALR
ncbi:MAG: molybdopterin molybdenumtransferase MoeA [Paracoccus denitrificans]|nr:MAG: molybdopterin molybdenumtransferase MoeA [Paracoccus denitrificans]PZO84760.1 MAG: molybdopterin molybdenumtransferase MoeA [Paracoccus denitrificans]